MNDRLIAEIERIRSDPSIPSLDEANVKQGVILPVLNALEWNPFNTNEVRPEYPVPGGNVDYALRIDGRNKVFLEAKRPSEELRAQKNQEQLLNYSFKEGVQLAVLTNGLEWLLYLPLQEGSWEQRWFTTIDLRNEDASQTESRLTEFLLKENVYSDAAVDKAKSQLAGLRATRKIQETLPNAWTELIVGPDEILVDLLDEKVAELCGEKAGREQVRRFLATLPRPSSSQPGPPPRPVPRTASPKPAKSTPHIQAAHGSYTGKTLSGFTFQGRSHNGGKWIQMLIALSEQIHQLHRAEFGNVLELKGRKRPYFSRDPEDLFNSKPIGRTEFYVEANFSANDVVKISYLLLAKFGYSPDDLKIETT